MTKESCDRPGIDFIFKHKWFNSFGNLSKMFLKQRKEHSQKLRQTQVAPKLESDYLNISFAPNNNKLGISAEKDHSDISDNSNKKRQNIVIYLKLLCSL